MTISVGIASADPVTDEAAQDLLARADRGLYRAKHAGRGRVCSDADDDAA